ncbi:FKBP-type peptidyl-prolyl cis-trans isomerase [Amycolatopsis sp. K13G38]|uniref:Peptidyl-prolyl cis-trans isomerase n=1 Tax=Amycolatopsis acididurans TaxID=2724524 RepID=A0ABX1J1R9_9PSEU|nr:FKBP-type peptidyl-prolyl cis-trans isomerase [Amycolatopsis acididurans]NKQ53745.1 FKBP-type peptidyl-prolyl cis-trans isomerase [Amycolatopsis acididurans]
MRNAGKILFAVAAAVSLAACVPNQEPTSYPPGGGPTYPAPNPATGASSSAQAAPSSGQQHECTADDITVTGAFGSKPTVTIPDTCSAPTKLLSKDLTPGTGAAAKAGSALQMNYDLVTWSDKRDQQNSFSGQPFSFTLGQGTVIPGWDQGLVGIKQGGRRLLVVPPDLGYGSAAQGTIKPNETLVFVVDAVGVTG